MRLNDKVYTILKWCTLILLPACATAYVALSAIWGWPYADEIAKTSTAVCAFLGAVLGISSAEYNKALLDDDFVEDDEEEDDNLEGGE